MSRKKNVPLVTMAADEGAIAEGLGRAEEEIAGAEEAQRLAVIEIIGELQPFEQSDRKLVMEAVQHILMAEELTPGLLQRIAAGVNR